mmetsp:Transcript_6621/g.18546  ORF Transcript_6621/g.18546 Transcript_6621/m.18546 type:complete len:347 (+) Transcript_6621:65-1105(+)
MAPAARGGRRVLNALWHAVAQRKMSTGSATAEPFNRRVKTLHRQLAARVFTSRGDEFEYLRDLVAEQLVDRVLDIARDFDVAVDLGCNTGNLAAKLASAADVDGELPGNLRKLIQIDPSEAMVDAAANRVRKLGFGNLQTETHACDFANCARVVEQGSVDMVVSNMALHWANDLPRVLKEAAGLLRPDGVFLGAMLGGDTLFELRTALAFAEQEREGGIAAHVSPMIRHSDACGLLSAAGLSLATVDTQTVTVEFEDIFSCVEHLSCMGESNANKQRRPVLPRETVLAAAAAYQGLFGEQGGYVPATFQIVFMIGWKPHASQPKPLAPGSAKSSFKNLPISSSAGA